MQAHAGGRLRDEVEAVPSVVCRSRIRPGSAAATSAAWHARRCWWIWATLPRSTSTGTTSPPGRSTSIASKPAERKRCPASVATVAGGGRPAAGEAAAADRPRTLRLPQLPWPAREPLTSDDYHGLGGNSLLAILVAQELSDATGIVVEGIDVVTYRRPVD